MALTRSMSPSSSAASASRPRGDLRRAVELYRGDLLPSCYDDWIAPERERLRRAYAAALERLIALAEDRQRLSRLRSPTRAGCWSTTPA